MKMRMNFRRKLALLMAGILVLGSIQLTGISAQAAQNEGTVVTDTDNVAQGAVTDGDNVNLYDVLPMTRRARLKLAPRRN